VPTPDFSGPISERLKNAGIDAADSIVVQLARYLEVLALWNRRINLTAFDLDRPSDAAIDRLIVEPVVASHYIRAADTLVVDIGSGGGSPAIPLRIATPALHVVLVEVRKRKAAFLREVIRALELGNVSVETSRFDAVWRPPHLVGALDLITMRAVRASPDVWAGIDALLRPAGRMFWFTESPKSAGEPDAVPTGWLLSRPSIGGHDAPFAIVQRV
jgi:16S rRNA (guanine527-N7)-methyltransferase